MTDPVAVRPSAPRRPADCITKAITARLEEAGRTLLALPHTGWTTRLRSSKLDILRAAAEACGTEPGARLRPAMPGADEVTRMDEAFAWLQLIPQDRHVLRRIVGARAMVSPLTDRHLYPWRRLATLLGADHKAVQRWHADGIAIIARAHVIRPDAALG